MRKVFALLIILVTATAHAQTFNISGRIIDATDTAGLTGVTVTSVSKTDTTRKAGTITDPDGYFTIQNLPPGTYTLKGNYVGFQPFERTVTILAENINLGNLTLKVSPTTLKNVIVKGQQIRAIQSGDTTQFNADAFKTNPDANAEDLVTKMPGVTSENGTLKVNGEDVKRVLIDGKPFFGEDPNSAVKNLPAEVIDRIQVFDRQDDQSRFTGFDNGETEKTINIITKPGKNEGQFGKALGGYGTNGRYLAGGNVNLFKGDRRISIIGLSNNINQQNFSTEDLLGVVGTSSGDNKGGGARGESRGGMRGGSGNETRGGRGGGGPQGSRGGNTGNFLVGQQGGISATNAFGLNYSDNWGKKARVSGSYFFNNTDNSNDTRLARQYITGADTGLAYNETSNTASKNTNHRLNLRIEYDIDSNNSLILTPRVSLQDNTSTRLLSGNTTSMDGLIGHTSNINNASNNGYNLNNDILYRHKFAKRGRTISANLGTSLNGRTGDGTLKSLNEFADGDTTLLDQRYDLNSDGYTLSGNLNYTEPVSKNSQLMINYTPSYTNNTSARETFNLNPVEQEYNLLDTQLTNRYDNTYTTHRGGVSYRYNEKSYNWMIGLNGQYANLEGHQTFPFTFDIDKSFKNLLPQAMFNYKFSKTKNLRASYRTNTNAPTINQLQNVVDNTNPLLLKTGNPDLEQEYAHSLSLRYASTNTSTATSFFAFLSGNFTQDYIGNNTIIPTQDSIVADGILVNEGSQLTLPVNLDGYTNLRSFVTYGMPVTAIKSNLNLNGGISYSHIPALINNQTNFSNSYNVNAGFTLGSNISENVDFTLNYSGNYNIVSNTLQTQANNTYYSQNTSLRFNYIFLKNFVFNTTVNHTLYTGLTQNFNQSFFLWNAYLGYKFLKDRSLEARISAYDILNQNRSVSRSVTETYIEDSFTNVLTQYFMFQLTYTLRNFKNQAHR